jgi:hypothetical protein
MQVLAFRFWPSIFNRVKLLIRGIEHAALIKKGLGLNKPLNRRRKRYSFIYLCPIKIRLL